MELAALVLLLVMPVSAIGETPSVKVTSAASNPKILKLDLGANVSLETVLIPSGEFLMGTPEGEAGRSGNESPQHQVSITKPFYFGKYEVTVAQFQRFVEATGYKTGAERGGTAFEDGKRGGSIVQSDKQWGWSESAHWKSPGFEQNPDHPVVLVSWNDAAAFMEWLSETSDRKVRFPTEAEWEYAARAGTSSRYWWGDDEDVTGRVANVADQTYKQRFSETTSMNMNDGFVFTAPVGHFQPNGLGLYDTSGNVWEWCSNWYKEAFDTAAPESDPIGPASGTHRVMRGGGWDSESRSCRSGTRWRGGPDVRSVRVGLRIVVDP